MWVSLASNFTVIAQAASLYNEVANYIFMITAASPVAPFTNMV